MIPPSANEAVAILLALNAAVEGSLRYLPDFRLPDKALDWVGQACAAAGFGTLSPEGRLAAGCGKHVGSASSGSQ